MTRIRPATPDDAAAIARSHIDTWRATYRGIVADQYLDALDYEARTRAWQETLAQGAVVVAVAEVDGVVVGHASGGPEREGLFDGFSGELYSLYVLPACQGRGLGRALATFIAGRLSRSGHAAMMVWVLKANPATRFYERLGGVFLGERPIRIGDQDLIEWAYGFSDLSRLGLGEP
jgi:ribosomal protein S18 acetylase RimI-like enzyme